ncbi:MAG: chromosome segregation protein SMC [Acidobacteriota bacterium]
MKLHSLDISGFKSFVDPVDVKFADGVTAIVGPNGCGKSNLSDAITWVLGEQSAKSLRGSKMEDVIFSGSAKRKPLGMAEVSLTLKASPDFAGAVDGKMTIGRRVFRSGESQYRLNGKKVRLKQIKDLLMDTGLGIRAYSVIEQGKIGMILSGKPQERRKLLEEAAGITRYKARKRIAEIKLEETTANLLRLDDIVSEVERSLRSLKRQASAARRYQAREQEYQVLLKQVLLGRWSRLSGQLGGLDEELAGLTSEDAKRTAGLADNEASLAEHRETLDELAMELAERHEAQAELAATIEGRQEFIKGSRQRCDEVAERLTMGRSQADERRRQSSDFQHSLGNLDERSKELLAERDEAARAVALDDEQIAACQVKVEEATARTEAIRQELAEALTQVEGLRSELQQAQVEIERRTYRQRFLGEERSRLERALGEATSVLDSAEQKIAGINEGLTTHTKSRDDYADGLEKLLGREAEASDEARQLENRLVGLEQRQRILVELSEEHAKRRRALEKSLAQAGIEAPRFLADQVVPSEGWEDFIDHFLGDLADAVVLSEDDDAIALARSLAEVGRSGIFLRPLAATDSAPRVDDPAALESLADALGLNAELTGSLPPAYLVETAADAQRLAAEHPGVAFVSRDRLWAQGGSLHVQGNEAAPGVLARESELESIAQEIPECQHGLEQTNELLANLVKERTRHAGEINRLEKEIGQLQRESAVAQARRQDAAKRHQKLDDELQGINAESEQIAGELEAYGEEHQQLSERLEQTEASHQTLRDDAEQAQVAVEEVKEQREALRTVAAGRRGRYELLEERLESHNQEATRIRGQITYAHEQLEIWSREDELLQRRLAELEAAIEQAENELQSALEGKAAAQEAVLEQQEKLDKKRAEIRGLEDLIQGTRGEREELRGRIEKLRIERAGVRQDAEHLSENYREAFRLAIPGTLEQEPEAEGIEASAEATEEASDESEATEEAATEGVNEASEGDEAAAAAEAQDAEGEAQDAEAEAQDSEGEAETADGEAEKPFVLVEDEVEIPDLSPAELSGLEADMARCKAILERLGPVNVLAAKEYDEQLEREEFLSKQRQDVAESVRRLQATIQEINETSSDRFRDTFTQVNAKFGELFTRLFRGGEAEMRLFDEEDILETGIEIIARPPGKRPQNIMLLSGGEKALTAIALLFALFETKPSPFCILDEVDAPLDDVNVLRFVETLKEMAGETQFLIITHNKLTMEVASSLYGVTMEERGVSKLVAVEMEKVHPAIAAASA